MNNMKRIAVFPGSFDPFTKGHESIVLRGAKMFDEIIIGIGKNSTKQGLIPIEKRAEMIEACFSAYDNVRVKTFSGLTVEFCKEEQANFLLRGLRSYSDFDFEFGIAQMNKSIASEIETVFLLTSPEYSAISSSIVRDIHKNGGNVDQFLPKPYSNKLI